MGMSYTSDMVSKRELAFTEKWFTEELLLDVGLFQLIFDDRWHCVLAGESCSRILQCAREEFWEQFQKLNVHTSYHASATTIEALLREIRVVYCDLPRRGSYPAVYQGNAGG